MPGGVLKAGPVRQDLPSRVGSIERDRVKSGARLASASNLKQEIAPAGKELRPPMAGLGPGSIEGREPRRLTARRRDAIERRAWSPIREHDGSGLVPCTARQ